MNFLFSNSCAAIMLAALSFSSCKRPDIGEPVHGTSVTTVKGSLDFDGEGDRRARIYVVTNVNDWSATTSDGWIRLYDDEKQEAELHGQRIVVVWVEDNDDTEHSRQGTITVRAGDFSQTLTVTQKPGMASIPLDNVVAVYRGDRQLDGRGHYELTFTHGEFDENGRPLNDKAGILNIECLNHFVPGVYDPKAAHGVYTIVDDDNKGNKGGLDRDKLVFIPGDKPGAEPVGTFYTTFEDNDPALHFIKGGKFEIDGNGGFKIRFHYDNGSIIKRFVYSGEISYENREYLSATGTYSQTEGKPINYNLRLYAGKMERNKIAGYGYEIYMECWNNSMYEGNYTITPGTYTAGNGGNMTFSAGTSGGGSRLIVYEPDVQNGNSSTNNGSHASNGNSGSQDGNADAGVGVVPITGGTVVVSLAEGEYTIKLDLTANDGRTIRGEYVGTIRFRNL